MYLTSIQDILKILPFIEFYTLNENFKYLPFSFLNYKKMRKLFMDHTIFYFQK